MNNRAFLPLMLIIMMVSCKKPAPKHVWTYDGWNGLVEILNGPVKEIYKGDSTTAYGYFERIDFDQNGNMVRREERDLLWSETNGVKDSTLTITRRKYSALTNKEGAKIAFVADYQIIEIDKGVKDISSGKLKWDLDKNGNLEVYHPDLEDALAEGRYDYDKNGNVIRYKRAFSTSREPEMTLFKYDSLHRVVEIDWGEDLEDGSDKPHTLLKTTSHYLKIDSNGNWVTRADYDQNLINREYPSQSVTVTRKITYYK